MKIKNQVKKKNQHPHENILTGLLELVNQCPTMWIYIFLNKMFLKIVKNAVNGTTVSFHEIIHTMHLI